MTEMCRYISEAVQPSMRTGDAVPRTREANRKKIAETEKRDAGD